MNDQAASTNDDVEDVGAAVREGRPLRAARLYRVEVSDENLNFRPVLLTDPVPLGRQILAGAGVNAAEGYSLFAILSNGDFEGVRLDEPFDLREKGSERFVMFRTDREFKFTLNDRQIQWGKAVISGAMLYKLASVPDDQAVYLEVRGGEDRLIEPTELFELETPGLERFITAPKQPLTYEIIVNTRPKIVPGPVVAYDQLVQLAYPGPHEPNVEFSITYRNAASKPHAGELGRGGSIQVKKKGTIINVCRTVQS